MRYANVYISPSGLNKKIGDEMDELRKKLNAGSLYYVKKKNGKIVIRQAHFYSCLKTEKAMPFVDFEDNDIDEVIAPVPTYEELQELKAQQAEYKEYCCCQKNEALLLENARLKERDKIYSELAENLLCIEENKWYNLVENGTKEQRINFIKEKEKHSLLSAIDKISKLKGLLKECYTIVDTRMLNLRGLYNTDNLEVYKRESERLKKILAKIEEVLK